MVEAPERAHVLIAKFGADTAERLADELRFMADQIDRKQLSTGCNGSPSGGAIYSYKIRPEQTHDAYFEQVEAWLSERKQDPSPQTNEMVFTLTDAMVEAAIEAEKAGEFRSDFARMRATLMSALSAPSHAPNVTGSPVMPSFFEMPTDIQKAASFAAVDLPFAISGDEFRAVEYALAKVILVERQRPSFELIRPAPETIPVGWKLVPIEATNTMVDDGAYLQGGYDPLDMREVYRAMINAAPSPETRTVGGPSPVDKSNNGENR